MKKLLVTILVTVFPLFWAGCSRVAVTDRRQLNLIPDSMMLSLSLQQYEEFLAQAKISQNTAQSAMVERVGRRIQAAVEQYFVQTDRADELADYQWQFTLVESEEQNAWVLPGGKVVVYTGLLPITKDEGGLATVLGHEIAHAVANHGGERMTHSLIVELGGMALDKAMEQRPDKTRELFSTAYGLTSDVGVILPFSRLQESEADRLGLIFMAMAGYDPRQAVDFWQRMAAAETGAKTPTLLSTHPSNERRISDIQEHLPEALTYYAPQGG